MISKKDVIYVADLANLELAADERSRFAKEMSSILEFIGRLNELNTDDVPPMAQIVASARQTTGDKFAYAQREDALQPCLPHDAALKNAPASDGDFFKVPRVIEK